MMPFNIEREDIGEDLNGKPIIRYMMHVPKDYNKGDRADEMNELFRIVQNSYSSSHGMPNGTRIHFVVRKDN